MDGGTGFPEIEEKGSEVGWREARRVMCVIKGKRMQVLFF